MALETLVQATDLAHWANRLDARSRLPTLLRRLTHATVNNIQRIGFPAEEGIQNPGYDGFLVVEKGNAFVPDGCSVWEMGAEKDIKGKADQDYEKRTIEPLDIDPKITTYIFVTPRRWSRKKDWIKEHKDGFWFDVRVYDADDLEQWLELAPSVHIWISILLGKHPKNAEDIATFWENWSEATRPALSSQLLTAGREDVISQVDEWLASDATVLTVKADTQQEAIAFLAALLYQKPAEERISWLSRIVLVNDLDTLNLLSIAQTKLILVPKFNPGNNVGRAIQNGHSVFVPLGRDNSSSQSTLELNRQHVSQIKEGLLALGLNEDRAMSLAIIARRSFMALRRKLAKNPELHEPAWASPEHAREIIPALLLGQWDETKDGDRAAITNLTNLPCEDVIAVIGRWANESDPPVRQVGNIWFLTSKEDAWNLLSRYIILDDLRKFETLAIDVLGEIDPSFDLSINQRWMAAVYGKISSYSQQLRSGLADTLAIMGAQVDFINWAQTSSSQEFTNKIVHKLLKSANADWRLWSSLSSVLRLLGEASPDLFLEAADKGLNGPDPLLINIFEEPENVMLSGATYPSLLSALAMLAWNSDYLSRAALILATLSRLDPGGKLGNRPDYTLSEIFQIWYPQTAALPEQRLRVIDMLRKHEGVASWKLMCDILPRSHMVFNPSVKPRWRDWVPDILPTQTYGEIWNATHEVIIRLLEDVSNDGIRWKTLIELLASLPKADVDIVISQLERLDRKLLKPNDHKVIWATLRHFIAQHRRFPNAQWAMPVDTLNRLNQIYEKYLPEDLISRYAWLFDNNPDLMGDFGTDWKVSEQALAIAKEQAINDILSKGGISLLMDMAEKVEQPYFLGLSIGQITLPSEDENALLGQLSSQQSYYKGLLCGFVVMRQKTLGWEWSLSKIEKVIRSNYSDEQQSEFFTYLPFTTQTWHALETFGKEVQEKYWSTIYPNRFEIDDFTKPIQKLLEHKRPYVALELIIFQTDKIGVQISAVLATMCLEMAIITSPENKGELEVYNYIDELLDSIGKTGEISETKLASLEFSLLPILGYHDRRGPKTLHKELSRNPIFFMEMLCLAYPAEGEEKRDLTENETNKARLAYELLDGWKLIPGTKVDGTINVDELNAWVEKARELAIQNKRLSINDTVLGQVISFSIEESDGTWPVITIRDLIEKINSDKLNLGFIMGVNKSRGATSRGLLDGGAQERELAERYKKYAKAIRDSWPRTASVLDKIVADYLSFAHHEDLGAELEEDLW